VLKHPLQLPMLPSMASISARRVAVPIAISVVLLACAVFAAGRIERDSAIHAGQQQEASQLMLTSRLDQETGARGYFETRRAVFLQPWYAASASFASALARSRQLDGSDVVLQQELADQAQRSSTWHAGVQTEINRLRTAGRPPTVTQALADKAAMDQFRALNAAYSAQLTERRDASLALATWLAAGLVAALSAALILAGILIWRRGARRENQRLKGQRELNELLQVAASEAESQRLLIRHVEQIVPGAGAAVLNPNNSDDRLEPVLGDNLEQTALRGINTDQLRPRSCMAVRLSRAYERSAGEVSLLECEVCGKLAGDVACEPLLVGGRVIGAVLVAHEKQLGERARARIHESVVQAAPILANQRNLSLAERRAASDVLTGLPNRRAADETIKRMAAHAGRSLSPLGVVLLDLDRFKQINDLHGHEQGDKALATIGQVLAATVRASDFAARYGGEEFLILLPDTDRRGSLDVAEKLRRAIERTTMPDIGVVTGSFGVACLPEDAVDPEALLRKADRALYAAKGRGRNRVEAAEPSAAADPRGGGQPDQDSGPPG
jgi:diguanylate cyclase (GGDEF)-like protein